MTKHFSSDILKILASHSYVKLGYIKGGAETNYEDFHHIVNASIPV
jgi:hypothetical protein